jgi:hypothetical protein
MEAQTTFKFKINAKQDFLFQFEADIQMLKWIQQQFVESPEKDERMEEIIKRIKKFIDERAKARMSFTLAVCRKRPELKICENEDIFSI